MVDSVGKRRRLLSVIIKRGKRNCIFLWRDEEKITEILTFLTSHVKHAFCTTRFEKLYSDRPVVFLFQPGENRNQNQTSQIRSQRWERRRDCRRAPWVGKKKKVCWKESFAQKLHRREKIFPDSASKIFSLIALYVSHVIQSSRLKY